MIIEEQKQTIKSTGVIISLTFHAALIVLLFLALTEKNLTSAFHADRANPAPVGHVQQPQDQQKKDAQKNMPDKKKEKATLNQPFVVPAPVVFYGNQTMINNPAPVSGHKDGKSAFEHTPSTLPTPPAQAIAPERTKNVPAKTIGKKAEGPQASEDQEKIITPPNKEAVEQKPSQPVENSTVLAALKEGMFHKSEPKPQFTAPSAQEDDSTEKEGPQAKKLTLADIFKNATTTIASFSQDGLPSARKAGTEGGDDQGSGHQITIKEGDMKYYTLWAKFLNHLNQAARFNRRGKEGLIQGWITNREIQYVLNCGITVDMQGNVLDIEIMCSSGCRGFDTMCISDIKYAVPYPPLPESLGKKTARFEVSVYP